MILDTSAIVAILNQEDDAQQFADAIERAPIVSISAGTVLEAAMVLGRTRGKALDAFRDGAATTVVPVDREQIHAARDGWSRYGRGARSKARVNYADCFSYAAARIADERLLFKGEVFTHTDIRSAL